MRSVAKRECKKQSHSCSYTMDNGHSRERDKIYEDQNIYGDHGSTSLPIPIPQYSVARDSAGTCRVSI